ncbi:MAG: hypothetical protein Q3979_07050 [Actinomycetaceae bacterium]|nr:hypothetical protein [Actinomycetaceae bacterium]
MMEDLPPWALQALCCPVTGAELTLQEGPAGPELVARSGAQPRLAYPVRDGIPVLLAHEARQV